MPSRSPYRLLAVFTLMIFSTVGCAHSSGEATPLPAPELMNMVDAKAAAKNANRFGLRLLQTVVKVKPGANVFLSPTSLSQALGLAYAGSEKETLLEMASVLGLPSDTANAGRGQAALILALSKPDPRITLQVANAMWSHQDFPFRDNFIQQATTHYGARAASLDFHAPGAADTINRWVSDATKGKIPTLVTADAIRDSSAVLTNAVYFKGTWQNIFEKEVTKPQTFTPETGAAFPIPMLHQTGFYGFFAGSKWQMVRLPYGTGRWGMVAVLPEKGASLAATVASLTSETFTDALGKLQDTRIALSLPRFKMTFADTMKEPLKTMGMERAFSPKAEFEPMFTHDTHKIDDVIHKTVLEVSEEGTEAAAATAVIMTKTSAAIGSARIVSLDRPFACFIVDSETGAVVFAGAVYRPEAL